MVSLNRVPTNRSRRKFLVAISASSVILTGFIGRVMAGGKPLKKKDSRARGVVANALATNLNACKDACLADYEACYDRVSRMRATKLWKATVGYPGCWTAYMACLVACDAQAVGQALADAGDWIVNHPGAVLGTIVVIGGVTFIVVATGGGGLALAPVLAL